MDGKESKEALIVSKQEERFSTAIQSKGGRAANISIRCSFCFYKNGYLMMLVKWISTLLHTYKR